MSLLTIYLLPCLTLLLTLNYLSAIEILKNSFVKPKNELFSRHQLPSRKQSSGESTDEFLQALGTLYFFSGLSNHHIRQRPIKNSTLKLSEAYNPARSLENAQRNNKTYSLTEYIYVATVNKHSECTDELASVSTEASGLFYFCGRKRHPQQSCPAREAECNNCRKKGHFKKVCKSSKNVVTSAVATFHVPSLALTTCSSTNSLNSIVYIFIAMG
nr:uncharacterized protein LOC124818157 [Hydra vulgaris]